MATENVLKTRIIHKHDTAENWAKATSFTPKEGELIVYEADANNNVPRLKVGDGKTNVNALPFTSQPQVQADWSESDESSAAYVRNKPFGEMETTTRVVINDGRAGAGPLYHAAQGYGDKYGGLLATSIVVGETYVVTFDGVEYVGIAYEPSEQAPNTAYNVALLSEFGDYSNVPLALYSYGDHIYYDCEDGGVHDIKIEHVVSNTSIVTLDEKFIPDTIARTADLLPTTSEANKYLVTDANGNATWADRLAYEDVSENIEFSRTLTVRKHINENGDYIKGYDDKVLYIRVDGVEYPFEANGYVEYYGEDIFGNPALVEEYFATNHASGVRGDDNGLPFAYVQYPNVWAFTLDNGTANVEVFEKVEQTKPLDPKYLPNGTVIAENKAGANQQLVTDAEGNTVWEDRLAYETTQNVEIQNGSVAAGPVNGALEPFAISANNDTLAATSLVIGDTYVVVFDGVSYTGTAVIDPTNVPSTPYKVLLFARDYSEAPIYFSAYQDAIYMSYENEDDYSAHSLQMYHVVNVPKTIDLKYLPAGLATETYVSTAIADMVDSAPETLNTLNELASALGDDPNFATTVATQIGGKVDKVNGKGLSTNDYTTTEKNKLAGISEGADAVSFTRSLTTGTKVGTITINGTGTDLYAPTNTDTTYSAGTGLALSGTTFNHSNSITAKNSWDGSKMGPLEFGGNLSVPELTYDSAGHITGHLYGNYTLPTVPTITNDEIDAICGANIVSASEVSL